MKRLYKAIIEEHFKHDQQMLFLIGPRQAGKTTVTPEDFATLVALSQYRSTDALTAAGIQIVDGKVVPLPAKTV